jgi:hypothetical protein
MNTRIASCLAGLLLGGAICNLSATPVDFTSTEQSLGALLEASIMTASMFQQAAGRNGSFQQISYSGSMTGSSWDVTLTGSYQGPGVSIELVSTAPDSFSANSANSAFGGNTWGDSGTWTYTSAGVGNLDMTFSANVSFLGKIFDREVTKTWAKSDLGNAYGIADTGQYYWTLAGIKIFPTGQAPQISDYIIPKSNPDRAVVTVSLPMEGIDLFGNANFVNDTTSGVIDFVPEPSGFALTFAGILALCGTRLLVRRNR